MILTANDAAQLMARKEHVTMDGWDLVLTDYTRDGYAHPNGVFIKGRWYRQYRFSLNRDGNYDIPKRYERLVR